MTTENKLTYYRKGAGLKQNELAIHADVSMYTIVRMEKDDKHIYNAKFPTLLKLTEVLEIKVEDLFE